LEHDPGHAESLLELIRIDRRMDRLAGAAELAPRLAALPGDEARGFVLLGLVRPALKEPIGAADALRPGVRCGEGRDPPRPHIPTTEQRPASPAPDAVPEGTPDQVRTWLARSLLQSGQPAEAREVLASSLKSRPDDPECHWQLSRAALQERDLAAATAALS